MTDSQFLAVGIVFSFTLAVAFYGLIRSKWLEAENAELRAVLAKERQS